MTQSEMTQVVEQWGVYELALHGSAAGNPFIEVALSAQFTHAKRSVQVDGFYDGEGLYRVRFMPDAPGEWRCRTRSSRAELDGIESAFTCVAPAAGNHGPVRVVDAYHFAYADGAPYHPLGTTCYVWNLQGDALEEQTLATLRAAPFNKLRFCVFPKRYQFNTNEPPCYPFPGSPIAASAPAKFSLSPRSTPPPDCWDFTRFNPAYFQHLERRILDLQRLGIEADLIVFHPYDNDAWGFDRMPPEVNRRYLKYLAARLSAFRNLWWSFANEYDLMFDHTEADWDEYFQIIQAHDPYGHPRSIHNMLKFYDHTKAWVTHCSVQHADIAQMTNWLSRYGKPVIVDECGYEGDINQQWGNLPPEELVQRFWLGFADGGYVGHGETYLNPQEQLWWSKGGELRGESVARIAFLRRIIEAVPGPGLVPLNPLRFSAFQSVEEMRERFAGAPVDPAAAISADGAFNLVSAGHCGEEYYLFYFGKHQPRFRAFNLPPGRYDVDLIDTWRMTIERAASAASGSLRVTLPARPYQALRIQRSV